MERQTEDSAHASKPIAKTYEGLSDADREALQRTARDLSDIDPHTLERIQADFAKAYERAQEIADGIREPMDGYDGDGY